MTKCLACGNDASRPQFSGAIGPFCSAKCLDANDNERVWRRATSYSSRVMAGANGVPLDEADVGRAFVIGYAAGLEDGRGVVGRRTVRK